MRKLAIGVIVLLCLMLAGCKEIWLKSVIAEIVAQASAGPDIPAGLTVQKPTITTLSASWIGVDGAEIYRVFRDTSASGTFDAKVYEGADTQLVDSGLSSGVTYYYKVQAVNASGISSGLSASVAGTTLLIVYVVNKDVSTVSTFSADVSTGELTTLSSSPFGTGSAPMSIAIDPQAGFLYTADGGSTVSAFTVDDATGTLTSVDSISCGSGARSIAIDPSASYVYVANSNDSNLSGYVIDSSTGSLSKLANQPFNTGSYPYAVVVHPSGKFLYVANNGSGDVSGYEIGSDGNLSPLSSSPYTAGAGSVCIAMHPSGKWLFVGAFNDSSIHVFYINSTTGNLTPASGSPLVVSTQPWCLAIDPSGSILFAGNTNTWNVTVCSFDDSTGALNTITGSPFSGGGSVQPWSLAVDPTSKYLFVAAYTPDGAKVVVYALGASGALPTTGTAYATGSGAVWVATTRGY
jgi:6-phosphogluconolactonase (cycloisomerase 2 family)